MVERAKGSDGLTLAVTVQALIHMETVRVFGSSNRKGGERSKRLQPPSWPSGRQATFVFSTMPGHLPFRRKVIVTQVGGRCVFCGGRGLTKGHVWPDWLNKILPKTATHHEQETGKFNTFETAVPGPKHVVKTAQGHARSRKPRNTCVRCNGGWMSLIEDHARSCATRLIFDLPQLMDLRDQDSIASLLTLIAMRLEFLGDMRAISDEERDWLRYYREPSEDWKIWISSFGGDDGDEHWSRTYAAQLESEPTDKVGPEYCNVRVTTLVMGKLCAHLFYSPIIHFRGYEGISLVQIWPRQNLYVDTSELSVMSGRDALFLHEAFARESPPMPIL
jgi:hypothetical protein